ncbi:hypothetical protein [Tsukamurella columbiensis]|uniref:Uncharacterized protein n=1 Tax=Tsukamurella columbiensis TaxID=128509 RepID=A0ABX1LI96_9ACTN|nr:hypothetical protein [Tsukamurella columbiensis]NMD58003.1 hypothetical protein [Tsukamurella columbiensis]
MVTDGMVSWLFAILGGGVLAACYVAVLKRPRREPLGKRVVLIALIIVTGRMFRAPVVREPFDALVGGAIGIQNAGYILSQVFVVLALLILLVLNCEVLFPWFRTAPGHLLSDIFKVGYVAAVTLTLAFSDLGEAEVTYLPAAYDGSVLETIFFALFAIICMLTGSVSLMVTIPAVKWTRGYLRMTFISYSLMMVLCFLYGLHSWVYSRTIARYPDRVSEWWYGRNAMSVSAMIMVGVLGLFILAVSTYSVSAVRARLYRYRALRAQLDTWIYVRENAPTLEWSDVPTPRRSRLSCWRAAKNSIATYRMMIELSDADFVGLPPLAHPRN